MVKKAWFNSRKSVQNRQKIWQGICNDKVRYTGKIQKTRTQNTSKTHTGKRLEHLTLRVTKKKWHREDGTQTKYTREGRLMRDR